MFCTGMLEAISTTPEFAQVLKIFGMKVLGGVRANK